jgi:hypothetical protein
VGVEPEPDELRAGGRYCENLRRTRSTRSISATAARRIDHRWISCCQAQNKSPDLRLRDGPLARGCPPQAEATLLNVAQALTEPLGFCPPLDAQAERGVRAVVAYIEKRPERAREDFTVLAIEAFRKEWPCP